MRNQVIDCLRVLTTPAITATDLSRQLGVRLSSLSSLLKKMCDDGMLERLPDYGPKKGYGYRLK